MSQVKFRLAVALILSVTVAFAQETGTPTRFDAGRIGHAASPGTGRVRHISRPIAPPDESGGLTSNAIQSLATSATIPLWSSVSGAYTYQMVGKSPFVAQAAPSTSISTPVVPVIVKFADGTTFDPTVAGGCSTASPVSLTLSSPVFSNFNYTVGTANVNVGNTQYADFYQRANFWKYIGATGGINPNYHLLLSAFAAAPITINVPAASGSAVGAPCGGLRGQMDINWFDPYLQTTIFPKLAAIGITPAQFPVFLFANVVMYEGATSSCCILGYHSAFNNGSFGGVTQTYAVADFDTTGSFGLTADVEPLSHEIIEWMDDPIGNNPTPPWGHVGQVSGCQSNLEVGDPLSGTDQVITMNNGYNYHVQEIAFVSWFYRDVPSIAVNGWYSSNNTFTSPSAACYTSTTSLSITPTTVAVGTSSSVAIKVAAASGSGTPGGSVTLTTSQSSTPLGTYKLSSGAASATIAFPAGTYTVVANYLGDPNFAPSTSPAVTMTVGTPTVVLSPISLTFASTAIGVSSASQVVTLKNTGTASLAGIKISLAGASPGDYSQSNNCGSSIVVNASCSITVTFKPTAAGTRTATLSTANNASGSPQSVPLTGTGTGTPTATLSATALTFASTTVGVASAAQSVTLKNSGTATLTGIAISLAGANATDYVLTNGCSATLAAAGSCSISVTFKPTASGTRVASVSVLTALSSTAQAISLTGTAVAAAPAVTLSVAAISFNPAIAVGTTAAAKSITMTNSGTAALSITGISIAGTNPGDFAQTSNCGLSLAAKATCTISVTFKPTKIGTRSATLNLASNAPGSPHSVALSGSGK